MTMVGAASLAMGSTVFAGMGPSLNGTDFDGIYDMDTVHHAIGMSGHKTLARHCADMAYHESGHATIGWLVGFVPLSISLKDKSTGRAALAAIDAQDRP